jgi:hypothetical protein
MTQNHAKIASIDIQQRGEADMTKPGPEPEYGETRKYHTIRATDGCWEWCKTFRDREDPRNGGAGYILETIFQSSKRKEFEKWFKTEFGCK